MRAVLSPAPSPESLSFDCLFSEGGREKGEVRESANGGYVCESLAALTGHTVEGERDAVRKKSAHSSQEARRDLPALAQRSLFVNSPIGPSKCP